MSQLTFKKQGLKVDWIGFNIAGGLDFFHIQNIADYLSRNFGFNSTIAPEGKNVTQSTLVFQQQNPYQVKFIVYQRDPAVGSYWNGIQLRFTGNNGAKFYHFIQQNQIKWQIFKPNQTTKFSLSRLDLRYFRKHTNPESSRQVKSFFDQCQQKLKQQNQIKYFEYIQNDQGLILKIGKRQGFNYYRVYQKNDGIQFELEMKKTFIKFFQEFLFSNQTQIFEDKISTHFYTHSKKVLAIHDTYSDWLINHFRKNDKPTGSLVTTYLKDTNFTSYDQRVQFFRLLQFLSFSRNKPFVIQHISKQTYYLIEFPVHEFLHFIKAKNKSYYQFKKVKQFLQSLQKETPFVTTFNESTFRSVASFPCVELEKQHKVLVARVAIAKELYLYDYPFRFPSSFLTYTNALQLQVKLELIQTFSKYHLQKVFHLDTFLNHCKHISSQKQVQVKNYLIDEFNQLKKDKSIQTPFKVIHKNLTTVEVENITLKTLKQAKTIHFYEII